LGASVTVGLRPDNLAIGANDPILDLTADFAENLGGQTQVYTTARDAPSIALVINGRPAIRRGDALRVGLGGGRVYLFDADGLAL
jgi:ABC-type sugar transport system ATPase subunit